MDQKTQINIRYILLPVSGPDWHRVRLGAGALLAVQG
ncbi:hypothetical protein METH_09395 [Leisingera methylohalidivorans DSM 14336]|uniref:Uncharacterized protein n=1 Tax=Leisingera methylohalidivorans DSM 14336 TaxID=999552 RepID=V9VW96_9RHOB|nr:hypothetical protein METH_09395 [Leisingera methylohalidivorans DSM 14336]